jgi:hypothetical protein
MRTLFFSRHVCHALGRAALSAAPPHLSVPAAGESRESSAAGAAGDVSAHAPHFMWFAPFNPSTNRASWRTKEK